MNHRFLPLLICAPLTLALSASLSRPAFAAEPIAQVVIAERGLVEVTGWDLRRAGLSIDDTPIERIAVTNLGEAVSFQVEDLDADGRFRDADRIVFFGQRRRGRNVHRYRFADHNVYQIVRLDEGEELEHTWRPEGLGPTRTLQGETPVSLQRLIHVEEDTRWARFGVTTDYGTDFSYMGEFNRLYTATRAFHFEAPGLDRRSEMPFTLVLRLMGRSRPSSAQSRGQPHHALSVEINGHHIGDATFDGTDYHSEVFDGLDPSLLRAGNNEIVIGLIDRPEVPVDVFLLDWFEVQYPIYEAMFTGEGEFAVPGPSMNQTIEITGLPSSDVHLICLTTDEFLSPFISTEAMGTHTVSFEAPCDDGLYALATTATLRRPVEVLPFNPELPDIPEEGIEYLIITHSDFRPAAERLAEHRRQSDGLRSMVVDVQDIYDRFNWGLPHSEAVRDGLRHIWSSWPEPRLRYVLLMGDASWDWHQTEAPSRTFIPTFYYPGHEAEYASDNYFAFLTEEEIPEVAIGRLPVSTLEEAMGAVEKILNHERNLLDQPSDAAWRSRILFAASDNPRYRDFLEEAVSNYIEGNFDLIRAYASNESPLDCTQTIVDEINSGLAFLSYVGHGARYVWQTGTTLARRAVDYEANFNPDRVDELHNGTMLPIVFGITCFTNNFDNPAERDCIGETMVLHPEGGALASIATSSYSFVHSDLVFCDQLFDTLFEDHPERVGDMFLEALRRDRTPREVRRMFLLLGDPAARMALTPLPGSRNSRESVTAETTSPEAEIDQPTI